MSRTIVGHAIPLSEPSIEGNAWAYVKDALDSGWVSSVGPYVDEFENRMARYFGVEKTVATVNGTAALHISLLVAGVQPGDEVIVPSLTFIATLNAIRYVGATPVFWDSQATHWNADPALLETLVTPKTKAIVAVHLFGHPAPMEPLMAVAQKHGLKVIEDAAEALGASFQGQPCGILGDIGCLSFNGNKTLTTGGGGLLVSRDTPLMDRAHYLINQAKDDALTFTHEEIGYNYRLTNLLAALGVAQLECLPDFLARRRQIFNRYQEVFANHPALIHFSPAEASVSACWLYGIALNEAVMPGRNALDIVYVLESQGIQARPFFKPGHLQTPYLSFVQADCPYAAHWHYKGFNLPSSSTLNPDDQDRVIDAVSLVLESWERTV